MLNELLWKAKVAARLHDPAEKALVLLCDPEGHEKGTSQVLRRLLGLETIQDNIQPDSEDFLSRTLFKESLSADIYRNIQRADWWAAAADRPQFPMVEGRMPQWARVNWLKRPVLIHPLTGDNFDLESLENIDIKQVKKLALEHFENLLVKIGAKDSTTLDWRKILLTFWRFGPYIEVTKVEDSYDESNRLGKLWALLPADTRIPDHSIWDHLDLCSAFAGAFAADPQGQVALLALSIGPVQSFIAAARKMEDLWAGSHLLSRLSWEAMRPLCEDLGPDAIIFPRLRGIPQVDLWLRDQMSLPAELFDDCDWAKDSTDANPLFSAALPNRFVAVVPVSKVKEITEKCTRAARSWLLDQGLVVVDRLLEVAGFKDEKAPRDESVPAYKQMREQLAGFPEVYWAAVSFSLAPCQDRENARDPDVSPLQRAMAPFFGAKDDEPCGFLASRAWKILGRKIDAGGGVTFYHPNPGVLYPAFYDLLERVLAASKAARPFEQSVQKGWRDSLTGENEWLTTDEQQLMIPPGSRRIDKDNQKSDKKNYIETLWTRVSERQPSWAKEGEHLGALSSIKRLWPTIFAEEVEKAIAKDSKGTKKEINRFVVSTHTMALAHQLEKWLEKGGPLGDDERELEINVRQKKSVALPRRLMRYHHKETAFRYAKLIPALLEEDENENKKDEKLMAKRRQLVSKILGKAYGKDKISLENYYALILMDGDRMGAILSGDEEVDTAISYKNSFHPDVRQGFKELADHNDSIREYGDQKRTISPNRHLAISGALNDFSQTVVRHVVEEEHLGRLIYAGGDDVLAMLPVADVLSCIGRLRDVYSGTLPQDQERGWREIRKDKNNLHAKSGYAFLKGKLMFTMGKKATASCGVVIAHHQAPLSAVMRELRATEKRAKKEGGRNAFSITVIKRAGGALHLTAKWGEPLELLHQLCNFLASDETSRRAVYHSLEWLDDLPDPKQNPQMLEALLAYQFARQSEGKEAEKAPELASRLSQLAREVNGDAKTWLANFLTVAEFLARETRSSFSPDGGQA